MMKNPTKWATICANEDFVCFQTHSGGAGTALDADGITSFVSAQSIEPVSLAQALRASLLKSRVIKQEEYKDFFSPKSTQERYEEWASSTQRRYEYSTRRKMFLNMKRCGVDWENGLIRIRPTFHEELESWSGDGIKEKDFVFVSESSSDLEVGEKILLALSRCR